jgi:hypothetical protein
VFEGGTELTQDAAKQVEYAMRKVAEAPKLEHQLIWEAFWDLSTERVSAMSLGPIPISKIHWYADKELELDEDEKRAFVWIIRRLDSHFIGKSAEKASKQNK